MNQALLSWLLVGFTSLVGVVGWFLAATYRELKNNGRDIRSILINQEGINREITNIKIDIDDQEKRIRLLEQRKL